MSVLRRPVRPTRPSSEADRREDRLVRAVVAEGFVNRLGFGIVTFALPLYALELGMSIAEIGLLVSAKALLQPAVKPLVGMAVDRWGTRRGYLAAVGFRFLASVALLVAATPLALFGVRLLQGLASAAQDPVSISVLAKGRGERVARRFSAVYAARDVGKVAAGVLAGAVLAVSGSFTVLWLVVVALAAVPLWVVWGFVHELPDRPEETAEEQVPEEVERILRSPRLRAIAMLGLFGGLTATMTHALFQVYASEVAGLDAGQIGLLYSVSVGALLVVGPLAGWVGDRRGHGLLASARGASNVVSSVLYIVAPTFVGMLLGRLVDESGKAAFRPTWGALLAQAARRAKRRGGRTAGALDAWLSLGEALGPLVAGLIWDLAGAVWFLVVRAVLGVAVELVLGRRLRRILAQPAPPAPVGEPLRPGPGVVVVRDLAVPGLAEPLHLVGQPGDRRSVAADPAVAAALADLLRPGVRPDRGAVEVDGQRLDRAGPSGPVRVAALVPAPPPGGHVTVAEALRSGFAPARPEELALAWRRAGLTAELELGQAAHRSVDQLDAGQQALLRVAMSLVGEPLVLVVDEARADDVPRAVLDGWPGVVVSVAPAADVRPGHSAEALAHYRGGMHDRVGLGVPTAARED